MAPIGDLSSILRPRARYGSFLVFTVASLAVLQLLLGDLALVIAIGTVVIWLFGTWLFVRPFRVAETALARSEARYRQLAEQSSDVILLIRSDTRRVYVSPAVESLLGYSVEAARTISMRDLIHPDDIRTVARVFRSLSAQAPRRFAVYRLLHRDGHWLWVEAAFCRLQQADAVDETLVTIRNATERQREADDLRLTSRSARLAQAEANEANRAKTEFLACMSHEIRTPLNAIIGFTALLVDLPTLSPEARHYGERIQSGGQALLTIVNDILDFSQVEEGRVEFNREAFALPLLIDECLSMVQQSAVGKCLSLDVSLSDGLPAGVLGDEQRLRQILLNLLNNAIKFTRDGSILLQVRAETTIPGQSRIRFSVTDTGMGIPPDDLSGLFQRFKQVDSTNRREHGGTGLGLAICKRLVDLMGGAIGAESAVGIGSTFWFSLDLPAAPLVLRADRKVPFVPKQKLHLLLAEDVALNQELVSLILKAGGHSVDIVENGAEAIMAVQTLPYDAVLMDLQMPYVDGLTATRAIRSFAGPIAAIPIIALTANVLPDEIRRARDAGVDDVIQKPFTAEQIYRTLERIGARAGATVPVSSIVDPLRPGVSLAHEGVVDMAIVDKLVGLLGDAKVKKLLGALVASLDRRFTLEPVDEESRLALRREAHSCVAGAGMLGFSAFTTACRALEATSDPDAFGATLLGLRAERDMVIAIGGRLASQDAPLSALARAA